MNFEYHCKPFDHQRVGLELSADKKAFALLMEMGTGKSKIVVDNATYLVGQSKINSVVIVAPKGVHIKWFEEDFPLSIPPGLDWEGAVWRAGDKKSIAACENLIKSKASLRVMFVNVDVFSYPKSPGAKLVWDFITHTDCLLTIDESHRIKNPDSSRTKNIGTLGDKASYKRILTGTPITNGVFDVYSQFSFLDTKIFGQSFFAFKHTFAEILADTDPLMVAIRRKLRPGQFPPVVPKKDNQNRVIYKNLDKLQEIIKPWSYRVTKAECLDLPEKIYQTVYYDMAPKQAKIYNDLKSSMRAQLQSDTVTVLHKMTLMLRLQQVLSGYLPNDDKELKHIFDKHEENPRLNLLYEVLEDVEGQVIIWARFQEEIRMIEAMLGEDCVTYYGGTTNRELNLMLYRTGQKRYIVGNAQTGGVGLNLTNASTVIYYSNDFNYGDRAQSEDRAHRIGQKNNVVYIDLEATGTIDKYIIGALRNKKDVADIVVNFDKESI
jgi:SNF2 family DNA or RNA helicase